MAGTAPTSEQLLSLLERAADELKNVQGQLLTEQQAHLETRQALDAALRTLESQSPISEPTNVGTAWAVNEPRSASVTVVGPPQGGAEAPALQLQLEAAQAELAQLKANLVGHTALRPPLSPDSDEATLQKALLVAVRERDEGLTQLDGLTRAQEEAQAQVRRLENELAQARAQLTEATESMVPRGALDAAVAVQQQALQHAEALDTYAQTAASRVTELEAQVQSQATELATVRENQAPPRPPTQIESELAAVRHRRDELNVELSRVEAERAQLRIKVAAHEAVVTGLKNEAAAAGEARALEHESLISRLRAEASASLEALRREHETALNSLTDESNTTLEALRAQLETHTAAHLNEKGEFERQLQAEAAKSQGLATKLLETRARVRELEAEAQRSSANVSELTQSLARHETTAAEALAQARTEGEAALEASRHDHAHSLKAFETQLDAERTAAAQTLQRETAALLARIATLETEVADAQQRGATAVAEWQHANAQYAQLHREMLTLLDQRDEARQALSELRG